MNLYFYIIHNILVNCIIMSSNQSSHRSSSHRSSSTSSIRSKPRTPSKQTTSSTPSTPPTQPKKDELYNMWFGFLLGSIVYRPHTTHHTKTKVIEKPVYYQSIDNSNNQNNNIEEPKYKAENLDCDDIIERYESTLYKYPDSKPYPYPWIKEQYTDCIESRKLQ